MKQLIHASYGVVGLVGLLMLGGCSNNPAEGDELAEIQGIWRHSDRHSELVPMPSLTFEFVGNSFRVEGIPPPLSAYGTYTVTGKDNGAFLLKLKLREDDHFNTRDLRISPVGGRALIIDRLLYRRIIRQ